jgi:arylsulfatase A-like enzyme
MMFSFILAVGALAAPSKPNIVYFLTDDQDQMLGSSFPIHNDVTPMPKTQAKMAEQGTTASNFFIHTPICNPSRSELLSGRYFHNIKKVGTKVVKPNVDWSMHVNETLVNSDTFARHLKERGGYTVGVFGKYLNVMPATVPVGFDAWMANGGGKYLGPAFMTKNINFTTPAIPDDKNYKFPEENYTTAVVGNVSIAWIKKVVKEDPSRPFFAYIAPKACHGPFNPAPWYEGHWDPSWPAHEPRPVNWNTSKESRADHHDPIPTNPLIDDAGATVITDSFKNRWRTLMSVDDVISAVISTCDGLGVSKNTYFFYSSDHGFQLGQNNILMDKRHVYDWDTRVHLLARGPGIRADSTWDQPATQVDLAPTWLALAGLSPPPTMDGKSLLPLLIPDHHDPAIRALLAPSTVANLISMPAPSTYKEQWRDGVFIEYYFVNDNIVCVKNCEPLTPAREYPLSDSSCGDLTPGNNSACWSTSPHVGKRGCLDDCYPTESTSNNFIGLRSMAGSRFGDTLYAEFQTGEQNDMNIDFSNLSFVEYYNASMDPWMMTNLAVGSARPASTLALLKTELHKWYDCAGATCP